VLKESDNADLLIMAAAVADYQPDTKSDRKIKKSQGGLSSIKLLETKDILKEVAKWKKSKGKGPSLTVGFAAETENLLENAQSKMKEKALDLIAVNDVSRKDAGFEVDKNQVTLIWKGGETRELPLMEKTNVADEIIQESIKLLKS
jgi:phosphopantothenoylcysteine decarboxylase/phosphopantothenate--cysteine ligase